MVIEKNAVYSKRQTAQLLGIHVNSVTNYEKQGILKGSRLGRRVFFTGETLLNAVNNPG